MRCQGIAAVLLTCAAVVVGIAPVHAAPRAASFVMVPAEIDVAVGERIDIRVDLHPGGAPIDTVRLHAEFDPAVLMVEHIRSSSLLPRTSPGNTIENERGRLSFGAFTIEPTRSRGTIATITVRALGSGSTEVHLLPTSRIIAGGVEQGDPSTFKPVRVSVRPAAPSSVDAAVLVWSPTHPDPDAWYQGRSVEFQWKPAGDLVAPPTYRVSFDARSDTPPTDDGGTATSWRTDGVGDGVWYFHLRPIGVVSDRAATIHRMVRIDGTPPNEIEVLAEPQQFNVGEPAVLRFGTTDEGSGIDRYELARNDGPFALASSPLDLRDFSAGTHFLRVRVIDRAGNATYGQTVIRAYPTGDDPGDYGQRTPSALPGDRPWWAWITVALVGMSIAGILVHRSRKK